MKAVQMSVTGVPEVLQVVDIPKPTPGPGQVLVQVESAAVNFSDVVRRRGDPYPDPTPLPFVPGAEIAGTVVELGEGVTDPAVGTRVFGAAGNTDGGYAEFAVMWAPNAIPLPEGLSVDVAAGLLVTGLTATVMLTEAAQLASGSSVFVPAAAGGFGTYAVQVAKLLGATVIAGAGTADKRKVALSSGADHAIDYVRDGWTDEVRELTAGRGVDVALEMTSPAHLAQTVQILAPFGRLVVYGAVAASDLEAIDGSAFRTLLYDPAPGQALMGFNLGVWFAQRPDAIASALQQLIGWVLAGDISAPAIRTLPLSEAAEAHRLLETGATTGKLILKP